MTESQAQQLVAVLAAAFPAMLARLDAEQQRMLHATYRRMLSDLDYTVANAALERLLATSRYLPTVAEIRETALSVTQGEQLRGGEAWGSVLKAIHEMGAYRVPGKDFVFHDPVTARCVAALGWTELCLSENTVSDRARFVELYEQLAKSHRTAQLSEGLPAMQRLRAAQAQERRGLEGVGGAVMRLIQGGAEGGDS